MLIQVDIAGQILYRSTSFTSQKERIISDELTLHSCLKVVYVRIMLPLLFLDLHSRHCAKSHVLVSIRSEWLACGPYEQRPLCMRTSWRASWGEPIGTTRIWSPQVGQIGCQDNIDDISLWPDYQADIVNPLDATLRHTRARPGRQMHGKTPAGLPFLQL